MRRSVVILWAGRAIHPRARYGRNLEDCFPTCVYGRDDAAAAGLPPCEPG